MCNLTVTLRWKATGRPSNRAGSYFHWRSAAMAAPCKGGGPEITFTSVTLPAGSTSASMVTSPWIWFDLASAGYVGGADLIRRATWTSPPTTGLSVTGAGAERFVAILEIGVASTAGISPGRAGAVTDGGFAAKSFARVRPTEDAPSTNWGDARRLSGAARCSWLAALVADARGKEGRGNLEAA